MIQTPKSPARLPQPNKIRTNWIHGRMYGMLTYLIHLGKEKNTKPVSKKSHKGCFKSDFWNFNDSTNICYTVTPWTCPKSKQHRVSMPSRPWWPGSAMRPTALIEATRTSSSSSWHIWATECQEELEEFESTRAKAWIPARGRDARIARMPGESHADHDFLRTKVMAEMGSIGKLYSINF